MSISVFLSTVSDEFRLYRDRLSGDLTRQNVHVKVQEDFKDLGGDTLDKLDVYIAHCDAVVHLIGDMTGSAPAESERQALLRKYPDLQAKLPPLDEALRAGEAISYTQWEAWLALYHDRLLLIAKADQSAPRDPKFAPTGPSRAAQTAHLGRLEIVRRYPGCTFQDDADLARHIAYTAILDLLARHHAEAASVPRVEAKLDAIHAEQQAQRNRHRIEQALAMAAEMAEQRAVKAEGFIRLIAGRVSDDPSLELEGMQRAIGVAMDDYKRLTATGTAHTNWGSVVDGAIARAKQDLEAGRAADARDGLLRTAAEMQRREEERRREAAEEQVAYGERMRAIYGAARDIALAAVDPAGAADAVIALAEALHGDDRAARRAQLIDAGDSLYEHGQVRGSNVHLDAAIAVRRATLALAQTPDEIGYDQCVLGMALDERGRRDAAPDRLNQAVAAYRAALEEYTRARVPLNWATTQNNLGNALSTLGERESGTARLEEAVAAYRAALEENTRARVPLDWAMTQNNLGNALQTLGARESGIARLEEAVAAYRAALEERTRARVPLNWATTQNNLGNALQTLGERESGIARLEEAVVAYRAALEERTRARVPLNWAYSQHALANALATLAERIHDRARLTEAIAAMRNAAEIYREGNNTYWLPIAEQRIAAMEAALAKMT